MCVCVYVCMHVCMYVGLHVYAYVGLQIVLRSLSVEAEGKIRQLRPSVHDCAHADGHVHMHAADLRVPVGVVDNDLG